MYSAVNGSRFLTLLLNIHYYTCDVASAMKAFGRDIWADAHASESVLV